ncbi:hypothetical protein E3N88_23017 [Mikania micrantha]|uniref:Leucine-rich repeat-containing N-terminal plant-type domain-containing protein n=1 Tax=Mikania micrantha TaxID=192012 RepID=A0A5N6NC34_9ASTR|nr:hypothetical protein E3N88_23017 [Mikania micrantha]
MNHKLWLSCLLMLTLMPVLFLVQPSQAVCIEEERMALLEIKDSLINSYGYEADKVLRTWVDLGECCDWERVMCNTTTGHVTRLSLQSLDKNLNIGIMVESENSLKKLWPLNVSLFLHFEGLTSLNLSSNYLDNQILSTEIKTLSRLKMLEILDLSSNYNIDNNILPSLTTLTSLRVLDLSNTNLEGTFPTNALASFQNLEVLDLSYNNFVGSIPSMIELLSTLKVVSFSNCTLEGSIPPDHGLCELKNIQDLDLSRNMLNGNLPTCFSKLSSLKLLDISSNQFTGMPPQSLIANLTALEYIDFSHNNFEGSFSFSSFSNLTKLEVVKLTSNNGKLEVETEDPIGWIPLFQLKFLMLPNCNMNMAKGSVFPSFLVQQSKLQVLDMSHNSLKGQFPNWLIKNNMELQVLNLRNNSFDVNFSLPLYENANAWWIDISSNQITGTIPTNIQKCFPYIAHLNFSQNVLSGYIPSSLGDLSELFVLDLSNNELSGEVPKGLFTNTSLLTLLHLSNNKLNGEVLSGNLTTGNIQTLHLGGNYFKGNIGNVTSNSLYLLDISNNLFTGIIPNWMSNIKDSSQLVLNNNMFEGEFPCGPTSFLFLDISENFFSGSIPSCLNLQYVQHLHLGSNRFTGSIPNSFINLTNALTLDIGNNNLFGRIPKFLGELENLRILLMRENNFTGRIPKKLCKSNAISLLDLSGNSLSGSIPTCLQIVTGPSYSISIPSTLWSYPRNLYYGYTSVLGKMLSVHNDQEELGIFEEVNFTTKSMSRPYKGNVLDYMTGLDLSSNMLTGEIPKQLGLLSQIHTLNLSNNHLTGPIPVNFSNLASIESLDLSSNNLSGNVPSELINLAFLSIFNVSNNNLSGRLPEMKGQFATFTSASYEGNPLLCGLPLEKQCMDTPSAIVPRVIGPLDEDGNDKWYDIDMIWFVASLGSTWVVFLLGFVAVLYTNPYWRRMCIGSDERKVRRITQSRVPPPSQFTQSSRLFGVTIVGTWNRSTMKALGCRCISSEPSETETQSSRLHEPSETSRHPKFETIGDRPSLRVTAYSYTVTRSSMSYPAIRSSNPRSHEPIRFQPVI